MTASIPRAARDAWPETIGRSRVSAPSQPARFEFRGRTGRERVDWRLLAAIDPDAVQRDGDIDALQAAIENLTFADVQGEGVRTLADANLVKLARLSQMCLEYLLHCQEALEQRYTKAADDTERWRAEVDKTRAEAKTLNKRMAHMKKALRSYEHLSVSRKEAGLESHEPVDIFKCHDGKLFVTEKHALAHIRKRYPATEHEALQALIARVPAAPRTDAGGSVQATSTAKAIEDARAEAETRKQQQQVLEQRVSDLAAANKSLAEQLESSNASVRNTQHLLHLAETRADQFQSSTQQLTSSLESARHELVLQHREAQAAEQVRMLELKRQQEIAEEKEKSLRAELERERGDYMSSIKVLLSNTSSVQGRPLGRSRAGFMEDDESSADEATVGRRRGASSLSVRAEHFLEELMKMSNMLTAEESTTASLGERRARGEEAAGADASTTGKLVNESIEVGRLRQALEELEDKAQRDRQLARDQQYQQRLQHAREVQDIEESHSTEIQHKESMLRKAHEQTRRAKEELDIAESDQRQAVQEALSLRRQLEALRADEKDAVETARNLAVQELEAKKAELEAEVQQLRVSSKALARERAESAEALEVAKSETARALLEVQRLKSQLEEEQETHRRGLAAAAEELRAAQADAERANQAAKRAQQDLEQYRDEVARAESERLKRERAKEGETARAAAVAPQAADQGLVDRLQKELEESRRQLQELHRAPAPSFLSAPSPHAAQPGAQAVAQPRDDEESSNGAAQVNGGNKEETSDAVAADDAATAAVAKAAKAGDPHAQDAAGSDGLGSSETDALALVHRDHAPVLESGTSRRSDVDDDSEFDIPEIPEIEDVAAAEAEQEAVAAAAEKAKADEKVRMEEEAKREAAAAAERAAAEAQAEVERKALQEKAASEAAAAAAAAEEAQADRGESRATAQDAKADAQSTGASADPTSPNSGDEDDAARRKKLASLRGLAAGRRVAAASAARKEDELDDLETIEAESLEETEVRPAAVRRTSPSRGSSPEAVRSPTQEVPSDDRNDSTHADGGGLERGSQVQTFAAGEDGSEREQSEREKSASEVEEVKDFVLTEDGTSGATPRHSIDVAKNILAEDPDTDVAAGAPTTASASEVREQGKQVGNQEPGPPRGMTPDPNAPKIAIDDSDVEEEVDGEAPSSRKDTDGQTGGKSESEGVVESLEDAVESQSTQKSAADDSGSDIEVGWLVCAAVMRALDRCHALLDEVRQWCGVACDACMCARVCPALRCLQPLETANAHAPSCNTHPLSLPHGGYALG
jgi:hypothetical protein